MTAVDRVLERLHGVRRNGAGWNALCPAHPDRDPSLSIREGDGSRVLLKCFVGCAVEAIVEAIGLELSDLFADRTTRKPAGGGGGASPSQDGFEHSNGSLAGLTLPQYAAAKKLPEPFLAGLGLSTIYLGSLPVVRMPYPHPDGTTAAVQFRLALEKPESGPDHRFRWKSGSKSLLYGLDRLGLARGARYAVIVEGASDCHTLWYYGIPALGLPGAGNWNEVRDAGHLDDVETLYVVIEPDRGGEAVTDWLAVSRIRDRVKLLSLSPFKDPSALHVDDPEQFLDRWRVGIDAAVPWSERAEQQRRAAAGEAYALARELLHDSRLLERVGEAMAQHGYAGDLRPPMLVYVGMTSRRLERPQNLAVIAQSASGKNRAVDAALDLIPPESVHIEKAGSARALIYTDEDFEHKVVVFEEADSIPEDGPAASAVRSLAADNAMAYDVVEKDPATGRFVTRRISKPGPTGLVTTSTRSLGEQMGTRTLEVTVPDDPEQTRRVMRAHARGVMPPRAEPPDLEPLLAVQRWLDQGGARQVAVPFADALADLLPATAVRMRRDFRQLLTCIQAIALLYQEQRGRTPEGWIEATLEDYARARDLLAPIFDTIAAEGVSPAIRQTVEAVKAGEEVSVADLAARLKLAKSTVSWRANRAVKGGWLVNNETRKGHPAKLARGAPLPEETTALPIPNRVHEVFECSNADGEGEKAPSPPDDVACDDGGGTAVLGAAQRCRCGNPLSPESTEQCAPCAAAWELWASVAVLGDRVACPTCDRLAHDDLYPSDDGELRCRQCIDDERCVERDEEDG